MRDLVDEHLRAGVLIILYGAFPKLGAPFWGDPYNKDYSILESILGPPYFGKLSYLA